MEDFFKDSIGGKIGRHIYVDNIARHLNAKGEFYAQIKISSIDVLEESLRFSLSWAQTTLSKVKRSYGHHV